MNRALVPTARNARALEPALLFFNARKPLALRTDVGALAFMQHNNRLPDSSKRVPRLEACGRVENVVWERYSHALCENGKCVVQAAYDERHVNVGTGLHKMEFAHGKVVRTRAGNYAVRKVRDVASAVELLGMQTPIGIAKVAAVVKTQKGEVYALSHVGKRGQLGQAEMSDEAARSLGKTFANAHTMKMLTGGATGENEVFINEGSAVVASAYGKAENWEELPNEFFISVASLLKKGLISWGQAQIIVAEYFDAHPTLRHLINEDRRGSKEEVFAIPVSWADGKSAGHIIKPKDRKVKVHTRKGYRQRAMGRVCAYFRLL
ncbi:Uncharacterised protein [Candidatus Anstonella stagnisolia]|nr:Uncharacterised protein [Candidatus Anstonella stagnisolia]